MSKSDELGIVGERCTIKKIVETAMYKQSPRVLQNVYVPMPYGQKTEIDIVHITRKGIFVIENKNWDGMIIGDEKYKNWLHYYHRQKYTFYNPVLQNQNHIKWLKKFLRQDAFCYSVIVFARRCEIKVTVRSDDILVTKSDQLIAELERVGQKLPDLLTCEQAERIYQKLLPLSDQNVSESEKQKHIDNLFRKYKRQHHGNQHEE